MSKSHFSNPVGQRPVVRVRADWSHATRRLIAGALCVACAGALFMPDAALAAEWVDVGGTTYNAGSSAGDEAGTWSWDGADDMKLNGYNGGEIEAAGKLNVSYSGNNTVTNGRRPRHQGHGWRERKRRAQHSRRRVQHAQRDVFRRRHLVRRRH